MYTLKVIKTLIRDQDEDFEPARLTMDPKDIFGSARGPALNKSPCERDQQLQQQQELKAVAQQCLERVGYLFHRELINTMLLL